MAVISVLLNFLLVFAFHADSSHAFRIFTSEQLEKAMNAVIDEPEACSSNRNIVILVKTAVVNFPHRRAIRETWAKSAKQNHNIGTFFVLARSTEQEVMDRVHEESKQHRDILMADFIDSYQSLTLKSAFSLNWINRTCRSAFAAYIDDDVVINPKNLLQLTESGRLKRSVHGFVQRHDSPRRDPGHKNYVSYDIYPDEFWPDYCIGNGVVMSGEAAGDLAKGALSTNAQPKVDVEDGFYYGIVAKLVGIPVIDEPEIRTYTFSSERECFPNLYKNRILMGAIAYDELEILWDTEQAKETQGCLPTHRKRWFIILMSCLTAAVAVAVIVLVVFRRHRRKLRLLRHCWKNI